jgi:hypothetical protein
MDKLQIAFNKFDAYNSKDPNSLRWEGTTYAREHFLALKLYDWVIKIAPDATEELLLASRSQHIGRWEVPRSSYPEGREAYLKWRKDLALGHAQKAGLILQESGYDTAQIERVQQIILKKKIKVDPEVQVMENALCLVFLQYQYEDFHPLHEAEKVITILRKSLLKMDGTGHAFALGLTYSDQGLAYIQEALKQL